MWSVKVKSQNPYNNLFNIRLMLSVSLCPKVITLSCFHCNRITGLLWLVTLKQYLGTLKRVAIPSLRTTASMHCHLSFYFFTCLSEYDSQVNQINNKNHHPCFNRIKFNQITNKLGWFSKFCWEWTLYFEFQFLIFIICVVNSLITSLSFLFFPLLILDYFQ
jgi:hypothetical protein